MKDFKNYTEENASSVAEKLLGECEGKNENEILKIILERAEKGKREGTLTNEEIERFYQSFSPVLTEGQKIKCRLLVERLKRIPSSS